MATDSETKERDLEDENQHEHVRFDVEVRSASAQVSTNLTGTRYSVSTIYSGSFIYTLCGLYAQRFGM